MQPDTQTSSPTNNKKILFVEDEHFIGELYSRALGRAGYEIIVEPDGQKGLTLAQTDQFDIILLDLMVPTMTGGEVLKALRDPAQTPHLKAKIIITTNLELRDELRTDIEKHADGYLVKAEITPRELVEYLSHLNV
jgi:CheY-like chemotaxis protein